MTMLRGLVQLQQKLKNILLKQKHAARIISYADRQTHARPLLIEIRALNITRLTHNRPLFLGKSYNIKYS